MFQVASTLQPELQPLRYYVRRTMSENRRWVAHCIDLDVWVVGDNLENARMSLEDAIQSYIAAIYDTEVLEFIPSLLERKALFRHQLLWYMLSVIPQSQPDNSNSVLMAVHRLFGLADRTWVRIPPAPPKGPKGID